MTPTPDLNIDAHLSSDPEIRRQQVELGMQLRLASRCKNPGARENRRVNRVILDHVAPGRLIGDLDPRPVVTEADRRRMRRLAAKYGRARL